MFYHVQLSDVRFVDDGGGGGGSVTIRYSGFVKRFRNEQALTMEKIARQVGAPDIPVKYNETSIHTLRKHVSPILPASI